MRGISAEKLSELTGIARPNLSLLENNKSANTTIDTLHKIAVVLDVNIKDLLYGKLDIQQVRKLLYKSIDKNGISAEETLRLSELLDLLLNLGRVKV